MFNVWKFASGFIGTALEASSLEPMAVGQPDDFDDLDSNPGLPSLPVQQAGPASPTHGEAQLLNILAGVQENQRVLAELLRQQRESPFEGLKGKDLARVLQAPSAFDARNRDEELARWANWSWQLEAWLGTLDNGFAQAMDLIRAQGSMEIEMATLSEKDKERSQLLFGILSGLLHERGKRLLRSIKDRNGYEAYRALLVDLLPGNRSRMLALLQLINQWPGFDAKQGFAQQMMKLESAFNEYDTQSPQPLSEDIKIACLLRCVSGQLKQHLNVAVTDKTKYADLRALVLRWDNAQTRWDTAVAAHYALGDGKGSQGPQPMEIDSIGALTWKGEKGKKGKGKFGKGKGKDGKSKHKDGKGKGFAGKQSWGWPNRSKSDKGGKGKPSAVQGDQRDVCLYCGKAGHWKRDCRKYKADQLNGTVVRQVAADFNQGGNDGASATASTVAPSHSASNVAPKRVAMISRVADAASYSADLTMLADDDNIIGFGGSLCMIANVSPSAFNSVTEWFDIGQEDACENGCNCMAWSIEFEYDALGGHWISAQAGMGGHSAVTPMPAVLQSVREISKQSVLEDMSQSLLEISKQSVLEDTKQSVLEISKQSVLEDTKQSVLEISKQSVLEDTKQSVREISKQSVLEDTKQSVREISKQSVLEDKSQSVHEISKQSVLEVNPSPIREYSMLSDSVNHSMFCKWDREQSLLEVSIGSEQSMSLHVSAHCATGAAGASVAVVRMVSSDQAIILDSGADCSALPMNFSHVGVPDKREASGLYVDAQGNPLRTAGVRVAEIQVGQLKFKERFIVSDVTMPLISLGKLYRSGWYVAPTDSGLVLTDGQRREPVSFRKQSLCVQGTIRVISEEHAAGFRAVTNVTLQPALLRLKAGWHRLASRVYAMKCFSKKHIDTTMIPLSELLWKRTTLVCRGGVWELVEFAEDIAGMSDRTALFDEADSVEQVITVAHDQGDLPPAEMGFEVPDPQPSAPPAEHQANETPEQVPTDDNEGHAELPPEEREQFMPPESIEIDGVIINGSSYLAVLKNACKALGLAENGNKAQLFKRLGKHCVEHELLQQKHVQHTLKSEIERIPNTQPAVETPTEAEIAQHQLTHEPYKPWCKVCVAHRARQNKHPSIAEHESSAASVVSFDFGFLSRTDGDRNKLTVLFVHDRYSRAVCAIVTPRKGGQGALSHMSTEMSRFILWLGHPSVRLRCDNENSVMAVGDAVRKILRNLGVEVTKDTVAIDDHQANGPVEQALQGVRQLACTFMTQLEAGLGAEPGKILFDTNHPMWQWAVNHAAWVKNHYCVNQGTTPYEKLTSCSYRGKICKFGETVMAYLKQGPKASAKWQRAIWLGKTVSNDVHVLGVPGGIFVSRSVRRFADCWEGKLASEIDTCVWQHGLVSLGGTLVLQNKQLPLPSQPALPIPIEHARPPQEIEDAPKSPSNVAGSDPPDSLSVGLPSEGSSMGSHGTSGMAVEPALPPAVESAPSASSAMAHVGDGQDLEMGRGIDVPELSGNPKPAKQPRLDLDTVGFITEMGELVMRDQVAVLAACEELPCAVEIRKVTYAHEDEHVELAFGKDDVDCLEEYDMVEFQDAKDEFLESDGGLDPRLCKPRDSDLEPECDALELQGLDAMADSVELGRLVSMGVLIKKECESDVKGSTHLTTKMVRTWRPKESGIPLQEVWYRRSRFVAREYAWLSERTDIFAPASTSLCNRLIPILFMREKQKEEDERIYDDDEKVVMFALDVCDAFLTVPQVRPTYVTHVGHDGVKDFYELAFVLPGQRSGSADWYDSFTEYLGSKLDVVKCEAHPSLLRSANRDDKFAVQMHVDDMLGLSKKKYLNSVLIPTLKEKYKISLRTVENVGDSLTFLKRKHVLRGSDQLLLMPSQKHFERLFELLHLDETVAVKKTPYMPQLDDIDNTAELNPQDSSTFRSGIGLLLYLAVDLMECQCVIRALASKMAKPTQLAMAGLRYLAKYLLGVRHHGLMIFKKQNNEGLMGVRLDAGDQGIVLESFSDSNWASCKSTRKSVSASLICVAGNVLFSSSRTQRVVALSSGEAELLSAASSLCDALFIREILEFLGYGKVKIFHHIDASAAKSMLERAGVGKVRHLSCRILWAQQLIKQCEVALLKVSTTYNPADLGTKGLSRQRTRMLMGLLHVWDDETESFVGLEELKDERLKQGQKEAVRIVRACANRSNMSKNALRAMVIAALCGSTSALGENNGSTNQAAEYVMAAYVVVFEQFPVSAFLLIHFVLMLIVIICVLQCNKQPVVVIQASTEKGLMSAEKPSGTAKDSEDEDYEPQPSSSMSQTAAASAMEYVEPEVLVKQKRHRILTVPVTNPVWHTGMRGKCYHLLRCKALNGSSEVFECDEQHAVNVGLKSCTFCNPRKFYHPKEFETPVRRRKHG